jgi:hypothetical protein
MVKGEGNKMNHHHHNQSSIALAHNPEHHARTKHIDIQYHFVRNCVEDGTTRLEYCPTEDMVADGFTKALGPERQRKLARMMGMGVWQKSEDYAITDVDRKDERDREGSDIAKVRALRLGDHQIEELE